MAASQDEAFKSLESLDGDMSHSPENKEGKKKRFQPFKAVKKFFNRKKSKDESASYKSKSTSELSKVPGSSMGAGPPTALEGTTLSFSAESIFSQKRQEGDLRGMKEGARSMQDINRELMSKSMSQSSDSSLFGMDSSENEDEFFGSWVPKPKKTADGSEQDNMNLDVVSSNTSLNVSAAKHRISVANKARRASSKHRRTSTAVSKTPLSKVEEKPKAEQPTQPIIADKSPAPAVKSPSFVPDREAEVKPSQKCESKEVRFLVKTKEVPKETVTTERPEGVVLRKKKETVDQDPSKRRTLSEINPSETSAIVFGDKVKRASSYESRNWEALGSSPNDGNSNADYDDISEFAAAFNKVRRMSSKRREELESEQNPDVKSSVANLGEGKTSSDESSKATSITYSISPTTKSAIAEIKKQTNAQKVVSPLPQQQKIPGLKQEKNNVEVQNINIMKEKDSQRSVKRSESKKISTVETFRKEEKTVTKSGIITEKSSFHINVSVNDNDPSAYKKTTPTQKPKWRSKTLPEQPISLDTLSPNKHDKGKLTPDNTDFGNLKRSSSQNLNNPSQTVATIKKPSVDITRPCATKTEPKKMDIEDTGTGDKQEPEWVLMVRKRKQQETEEDASISNKGEKEKKESVNFSVKNTRESIQKTENANAKIVKEEVISPVKDEESTVNQMKSSIKMKESFTNQKDLSTNKSSTLPAVSNQQNVLINKKMSQLSTPVQKVEEAKSGSSPASGKIETSVILEMEGEDTKCSEVSVKRKSRVRDMVKSYQNL